MKTRVISIVFFMILLAACTPASIAASTATTIAPTTTLVPTLTDTSVPPTPTPESTLPPATLIPTRTPLRFLLTPDAIQVAHWQDYQAALIKVVMAGYIKNAGKSASLYDYASCEWDILGRASQKVYVWAYCGFAGDETSNTPVVITLNADGSIQKMEAPRRQSEEAWNAEVRKMFPADVLETFDLYQGYSMFHGRIRELMDHLKSRETSGGPPLNVLSATPVP